MSNLINRVTIVGGGTAGWLTALILNADLNNGPRERRIKVTVIESPRVPTIGVGESTIQNLKQTLSRAGLDEAQFLRDTNGSFKLGVHYVDWSRADGKTSSRFFHPLDNPRSCGTISPSHHLRKFGPHWIGTSYGENVLPNAAVIAAGKGPRPFHMGNYVWDVNYAYHLDAMLFAQFMCKFAVAHGVEHIRDDVVDMQFNEAGAVSSLQLEQRGVYPVEFVVDCTGFKALIWSRMGAAPFRSANHRLLNDRAIPVQVPHRDPTKIEPCTRAVALGAGWVWRVPLYSRVGTGYVYSSAFRSDDEARAEFFSYLRASGDLPTSAPDPETNVIKMRIGHTIEPWIKNCVAIGLSAGFVEPLEATAIYSIDIAAQRLVMNFPDRHCNPALAKAYNARATAIMEEVLDFLQMNYVTSNRTEPYWAAVREEARLSDWLRDKLELWRFRFPDPDDTHNNVLFTFHNFLYVLQPKGYFANVSCGMDRLAKIEDWKKYGRDLNNEIARLLSSLPSHYELLTQIRNSSFATVDPFRSLGAIMGRR